MVYVSDGICHKLVSLISPSSIFVSSFTVYTAHVPVCRILLLIQNNYNNTNPYTPMFRRWWVLAVKRYYILQITAHEVVFNSRVANTSLTIINYFFNFFTPTINVNKTAMLIENIILQCLGNRRVITAVSWLEFYSICIFL